jgi:ribosome-associated protein
MLQIREDIVIPEAELEFRAIRASGPGGQNVNKVSTAIQLRFNFRASEVLDAGIKARLSALPDRRISNDGEIVIKAQRFRSQDKNRDDALQRLAVLLQRAMQVEAPRKKTRPGRKAREKRLQDKSRRSALKQQRSKPLE